MRLLLLLLLAATVTPAAMGAMYKWVDEKGVTHYGDTLPPQAAGRGQEELNRSGVIIKRTPAALTPEQRKVQEDAALKEKAEAQKTLEQKRRDSALLNTYTTPEEIDLARNRSLQQQDGAIQSIQVNIKSAQARLASLQAQAARVEKGKRPIPPDLSQDIQDAQTEVARLGGMLEQRRAERAQIEAKYAADKARFLELKGKTVTADQ